MFLTTFETLRVRNYRKSGRIVRKNVPYKAEARKDSINGENCLQGNACFVNELEDQEH